jgi:hypothetical protein
MFWLGLILGVAVSVAIGAALIHYANNNIGPRF